MGFAKQIFMSRQFSLIASISLMALAIFLLSCASSNPNLGRVLVSIAVTPAVADAQNSPDGQVTFTATGTFNLPPSPAPLSPAAPYNASFVVANPVSPPAIIANVVSTGNSTVTVQCASGASGNVPIVASASANNPTGDIVSGSATLVCP
jgi:hypothetical protein